MPRVSTVVLISYKVLPLIGLYVEYGVWVIKVCFRITLGLVVN